MHGETVSSVAALRAALGEAVSRKGATLLDVSVGLEGGYQRKTDREIPVFVLEPAE